MSSHQISETQYWKTPLGMLAEPRREFGGNEGSQRLLKALEAVQPSTIRLWSLVAFIGSPSWNWDHPDVGSPLEKIAIDTNEVQKA